MMHVCYRSLTRFYLAKLYIPRITYSYTMPRVQRKTTQQWSVCVVARGHWEAFYGRSTEGVEKHFIQFHVYIEFMYY